MTGDAGGPDAGRRDAGGAGKREAGVGEPVNYLVARIRRRLAEDARTNLLDVDVKVASGRVFLLGVVDSAERKQAAREVVSELVPQETAIMNELWIATYDAPGREERVP